MSALERETVELQRDCEAVRIPDGTRLTLFKGTEVTITQSLGGAYTVVTHQGLMASIPGRDADALGKVPAAGPKTTDEEGRPRSLEDLVWDQLKTCYDPEIPHNIVDLGLIYDCKVTPAAAEGGSRVDIRMTLTAPGCGMGDWLRQDARNKILTLPGIKEVVIDLVFDPPWDPSKMKPALRRALNL
jgi:probable FeS assembly SUF system protein SufT